MGAGEVPGEILAQQSPNDLLHRKFRTDGALCEVLGPEADDLKGTVALLRK